MSYDNAHMQSAGGTACPTLPREPIAKRWDRWFRLSDAAVIVT
jgi:hypothetical protein